MTNDGYAPKVQGAVFMFRSLVRYESMLELSLLLLVRNIYRAIQNDGSSRLGRSVHGMDLVEARRHSMVLLESRVNYKYHCN
jgi:hypothetical protein